MHIADAEWIPATPQQTWEALADPTVLRQCMPGLVQTSAASATEHAFALRASVGGVASDYEGELLIADVDAPNAFAIAFESKGQATGLVIGTGRIELSAKDGGTRLAYTLDLRTGGLLAKMGEAAVGRAVDRLLSDFFAKLIDHAGRLPRLPVSPESPESEAPTQGLIHSNWSWLVVALLIAVFILYHYLLKK